MPKKPILTKLPGWASWSSAGEEHARGNTRLPAQRSYDALQAPSFFLDHILNFIQNCADVGAAFVHFDASG